MVTDYGQTVNPPPTKKLTPRRLVEAILALEGRRVDLVAIGLATGEIDAQLRRARMRLTHGEYDVKPKEMGAGR
jgi:hypothetical protein